ncbi:uncharacterized protein METZ01_LOCUS287559, partial [marine metagenome]
MFVNYIACIRKFYYFVLFGLGLMTNKRG